MPTVQTPSLAKRVLQICCSIAWCLVAAGPVFGFAALKPILISEGVYSERCDVESVRNDAFDYLSQKFVSYVNVDSLSKDLTPCVDQDLSLNLMFTLAAVVTNVAALPVGSILDGYGPRVCGMLPLLLKNVKPYLSKLQYFIYRLGSRINYEDEKECLSGILKEISLLYVPESISNEITLEDTNSTSDKHDSTQEYERQVNVVKRNELDHVLEHTLFPALKQRFIATDNILGAIVQIADLPGLYKVFERC